MNNKTSRQQHPLSLSEIVAGAFTSKSRVEKDGLVVREATPRAKAWSQPLKLILHMWLSK